MRSRLSPIASRLAAGRFESLGGGSRRGIAGGLGRSGSGFDDDDASRSRGGWGIGPNRSIETGSESSSPHLPTDGSTRSVKRAKVSLPYQSQEIYTGYQERSNAISIGVDTRCLTRFDYFQPSRMRGRIFGPHLFDSGTWVFLGACADRKSENTLSRTRSRRCPISWIAITRRAGKNASSNLQW